MSACRDDLRGANRGRFVGRGRICVPRRCLGWISCLYCCRSRFCHHGDISRGLIIASRHSASPWPLWSWPRGGGWLLGSMWRAIPDVDLQLYGLFFFEIGRHPSPQSADRSRLTKQWPSNAVGWFLSKLTAPSSDVGVSDSYADSRPRSVTPLIPSSGGCRIARSHPAKAAFITGWLSGAMRQAACQIALETGHQMVEECNGDGAGREREQ